MAGGDGEEWVGPHTEEADITLSSDDWRKAQGNLTQITQPLEASVLSSELETALPALSRFGEGWLELKGFVTMATIVTLLDKAVFFFGNCRRPALGGLGGASALV